jgi:hypothetical protein
MGELSAEGKAHSIEQVQYILERIKKMDGVSFVRLDDYIADVVSEK